jgi:hypothetical protein
MWDVIVLVLQAGSLAVLAYGGIIAISFSHFLPGSSSSTFDEAKVIELRDQAESSSAAPTPATSWRAQAVRPEKTNSSELPKPRRTANEKAGWYRLRPIT